MPDKSKITTRVRRKLDQQGRVLSTTVDRLETVARPTTSPEARASRAEAGARNLATWKEQQAPAAAALRVASDEFRASLTKDAGSEPSAAQRVLIEGATAGFTAMRILGQRLQKKGIGFQETLATTKEIGTVQKWLSKSLRALDEMNQARANPSGALDAELNEIEREIHAKRGLPS